MHYCNGGLAKCRLSEPAKSLFTNVRTGKVRSAKKIRISLMTNRISNSLSAVINVLFVAGVFGAMTIALTGTLA